MRYGSDKEETIRIVSVLAKEHIDEPRIFVFILTNWIAGVFDIYLKDGKTYLRMMYPELSSNELQAIVSASMGENE